MNYLLIILQNLLDLIAEWNRSALKKDLKMVYKLIKSVNYGLK